MVYWNSNQKWGLLTLSAILSFFVLYSNNSNQFMCKDLSTLRTGPFDVDAGVNGAQPHTKTRNPTNVKTTQLVGKQLNFIPTSIDKTITRGDIASDTVVNVGEQINFEVVTKSNRGDEKTTGGNFFSYQCRGPAIIAGDVNDLENGIYNISISLPEVGLYNCTLTLMFQYLLNGLPDYITNGGGSSAFTACMKSCHSDVWINALHGSDLYDNCMATCNAYYDAPMLDASIVAEHIGVKAVGETPNKKSSHRKRCTIGDDQTISEGHWVARQEASLD